MGMNSGIVIIIMETALINIPRNSRITCIAMTITIGSRGRSVVKLIKPLLASVKARISLKAFDPVRSMNSIPVVMVVFANAFFTTSQLNRL